MAQDPFLSLVNLANKLVWKSPDFNLLHSYPANEYPVIARVLHEELTKAHSRGKLMLPDLTAFGNTSVAVFSDYAGESSGSYNTYSVLVCGCGYIGTFAAKMIEVRKAYSLGAKEIAFKDFGMGQLRRALPEYLTTLNNLLPGLLCTVVVDKRVESLFGIGGKWLAQPLQTEGIGEWKANTTEKLLRVAHLTGFLTALLTHNGQKIFWMTDHDDLCANEDLHMGALRMFERAIKIYKRPGQEFGIIGGARPFTPRSLDTLDILSACDVSASSVEHYFTRKDKQSDDELSVKAGAESVLRWLANDGVGLKKTVLIIKQRDDGQLGFGTVEFTLVDKPADLKLIPVFM